jgi:hypothetical protein
MKRIVFTFEPLADQTHIHRLRNFGEDLFHMFRDDGRVPIDLDEIDRATGQFSIVVKHRRQLHRTLQAIEPVLAKHFPDRIATTRVQGTEGSWPGVQLRET